MTPHLTRQAASKGISLEAIQQVLAAPQSTYPSYEGPERKPRICPRHGVQQQKWIGKAADGTALCIAVNPCCSLAITVFLDRVETALRPDQKGAQISRDRERCIIHEVKRPRREGPPKGSRCTCQK